MSGVITRNPSAIYTERRALTGKRCDRPSSGCNKPDCTGWIEPGERFVRGALPPHSDLGNQGWWVLNFHAPSEPQEGDDDR